ncbi:MAG: hypothetical protein R6U63_08105 [Longimicrobiales bacterium]
MIRRDTHIEELVEILPEAVSYLMEKGVQCIACGAPIWGTLEEAARSKGFSDAEIDAMVADLRALEEKAATESG